MDYELLSYAFVAMSLGLLIGTLIGKKRIVVFPLLLAILAVLVLVMEAIDFKYYKQLFGEIEKMDYYTMLYSAGLLFITFIFCIFKKRKKVAKKVDAIEEKNVYVDDKIYYFNLMNKDYAYYNETKDVYVLNTSFRTSLNESRIEVPSAEFKKFMLMEDELIYDAIEGKDYTANFRLKNKNGYEWYEEVSVSNGLEIVKVVYKAESKLGKDAYIGNYKDLEREIKELNKQGKNFGLALSNIVSIKDMNNKRDFYKKNDGTEVLDKDLKSLIIAKYITKMLSGYYKGQIKVYRLANMEYAFLILTERAYETFERELYNNTSEFIQCEISLNNMKSKLFCKLGLVYSAFVKTSNNYQVINAAFDMLQMVISSSFKQDYAIYQNSNMGSRKYQLKDMGIDLENDIKSILKEDEE